jgi:hypothetical protein
MMKVESLDELKRAFERWRRKKRHPREAVPEELLTRGCRTIEVHGLGRVARATKVDQRRLKKGHAALKAAGRGGNSLALPMFSRVELVAPAANAGPFAELETAAGLRLRIFRQTDEVLGLLAAVCGAGGGR